MAERQLPKLHTRVRFPSPAPATWPVFRGGGFVGGFASYVLLTIYILGVLMLGKFRSKDIVGISLRKDSAAICAPWVARKPSAPTRSPPTWRRVISAKAKLRSASLLACSQGRCRGCMAPGKRVPTATPRQGENKSGLQCSPDRCLTAVVLNCQLCHAHLALA
jgi:hypothetical protein